MRKIWKIIAVLVVFTLQASNRNAQASNLRLGERLKHVFSDSRLEGALVAAEVFSLDSDTQLYALDSYRPMMPASALKVFTAAAALDCLGPEYVYKTEVFASGSVIRGSLRGDLYLRGNGDPSMVTERMDLLAREVFKSGIRSVTGKLYFDDSAFEIPSRPPARKSVDTDRAFNAPIGALNFNYNSVELEGAARKSAGTHYLSVPDPSVHSSRAFLDALKLQGVRVAANPGGLVRKAVPAKTALVGSLDSLPLREIVVLMNKYSNNFIADDLIKSIGLKKRGAPGTMKNGLSVLREYAKVWKLDEAMDFESGSGLQRSNRATADSFIQLFRSISKQFGIYPEFLSSLPLAGRDGTLRDRLKKSLELGVVRAKSGTIDGVASLVGVVRTPQGDTRAFAVMVNLLKPETRDLRFWEDEFIDLIMTSDKD